MTTQNAEAQLPQLLLDQALQQLSLVLHGFGCRFPGGRLDLEGPGYRITIEERPSIVVVGALPSPPRMS